MKSHPGGAEHTRRMLELSSLPEGAAVLDMGAGAGETLEMLRERGFAARGIDLAPRSEAVEQGDLLRVPFPDEEARAAAFHRKFDKVISLEEGFTAEEMADRTDTYNYRDIDRLCDQIKVLALKDVLEKFKGTPMEFQTVGCDYRKKIEEKGLKINREGNLESQKIIFDTLVEQLDIIDKMSDGCYLTDRSPIDAYVYTRYLKAHNPGLGITEGDLQSIVFLDLDKCGNVVVVDDKFRDTNLEYRQEIDWLFKDTLLKLVLSGVLPSDKLSDAISGTRDERLSKFIELIGARGVFDAIVLNAAAYTHTARTTQAAVAAQRRGGRAGLRSALFPPAESLAGDYPELKAHPALLPLVWQKRLLRYLRGAGASRADKPAETLRLGRQRLALLREYGILE